MNIDCDQIVIFVDFISDHDVNFVKLMFSSTKKNFISIELAYEL